MAGSHGSSAAVNRVLAKLPFSTGLVDGIGTTQYAVK
jgi:hypothetical protein